MENKVLFGIEKVHIAKLTETNGTISYDTPFPVKGAVGFSFDPEGEEIVFYADNVKYFVSNSNQGYKGDLEVAMTPEEFLEQILGQVKTDSGLMVETSEDVLSRFALLFQAEGDLKKRRFCFFDCTAGRPSRENKTKEQSVDVGTEKISITMNPRSTDKVVKAYAEVGASSYDTFFEAVPTVNLTV